MTETMQIRRYPNRRFYDRSSSKYVSLDDIEAAVHNGKTVEIQDSQTGEDITRAVLTRIIIERNPEKMELFPTRMLHFILRSNEMTKEFLRDYLQHSLTYLDYLQRHGSHAPVHWVKAWMDGIRAGPPQDDQDDDEASGTGTAEELARQVELLEQRIRQLESKEDTES